MNPIRTYIQELQNRLGELPVDTIRQVIELLHDARLGHRQIFILGNGGSAATASHFACDLGKNTRQDDWPNFKVMSLTDNVAAMTAYANDEGYEQVFAQQLANFVLPGDVVIGISASGNSPNVINAIRFAKKQQAITVGFTGFDGGQIGPLVDFNLHVSSSCIEHVEDIHLALEHMICQVLKSNPSLVQQETNRDYVLIKQKQRFPNLKDTVSRLGSNGKLPGTGE